MAVGLLLAVRRTSTRLSPNSNAYVSPSSDHFTLSAITSNLVIHAHRPLNKSRRRKLRSRPVDRASFPEGCKATAVTAPLCSPKMCNKLQSYTRQMQTMPSSLPLSKWDDPTKPRAVMVPLWWRSSLASARFRRSYMRMYLSIPPDTRRRPAFAAPLGTARERTLP